jgi:hypothetical protein
MLFRFLTSLDFLPDWERPRYGPLLKVKGSLADLPQVSYRELKRNERVPSPMIKLPFDRTSNFYMRYIEPSEDDLDRRAEYDMDEQDFCWLREMNEHRKDEDLPAVTEDVFEIVIDQLEKEWFHLVYHCNHILFYLWLW